MSRRLPKVLTDAEQEALTGQFNRRYYSPHRFRAMIVLMLDTGLRPDECLSLKMDHVDLERRRILVRDGKGSKDRTVWFGERTERVLRSWFEDKVEADWVFPTRKGTKTAASSFRRAIKREAKKAGITEADRVSPHQLRHTFATDLLEETGNLEIVRKALGHSNISTTQIYLHLVDEVVEEAMAGLRD